MTEWMEWQAGPEEILLEDGRLITVDNGDLLLAEIDPDDYRVEAYLDHDPVNRSVH